jgi:hypothetical protein
MIKDFQLKWQNKRLNKDLVYRHFSEGEGIRGMRLMNRIDVVQECDATKAK